MSGDLDRSLLDRLAALRGSSAGAAPPKVSVDVIERTKTPTREDTLAARLKNLRDKAEASPGPSTPEQSRKPAAPVASSSEKATLSGPDHRPQAVEAGLSEKGKLSEEDDVDAAFATDDQTLEELLGDVGTDDQFVPEPDDAKVKALLEELSRAVPKDSEPDASAAREGEDGESDDDSDGEKMSHDVKEVIARLRDEMEVDAALGKAGADDKGDESGNDDEEAKDDDEGSQARETAGDSGDIALPSVPTNLGDFPIPPGNAPTSTTAKPNMDDISARLAALRASSSSPPSSLSLPSVPTGRPAPGDKPVNRLTSRTNYTDDDVDSWCTVCLEDATLRCLGCDDDPYCVRCWHEMHVGPAAAFDDRTHKAVQFSRDKKKRAEKKKVAIGA